MKEQDDVKWEEKPNMRNPSEPSDHWMEEPRYRQLFNEIEDKISGVLGRENLNGQIEESSIVCSIRARF